MGARKLTSHASTARADVSPIRCPSDRAALQRNTRLASTGRDGTTRSRDLQALRLQKTLNRRDGLFFYDPTGLSRATATTSTCGIASATTVDEFPSPVGTARRRSSCIITAAQCITNAKPRAPLIGRKRKSTPTHRTPATPTLVHGTAITAAHFLRTTMSHLLFGGKMFWNEGRLLAEHAHRSRHVVVCLVAAK